MKDGVSSSSFSLFMGSACAFVNLSCQFGETSFQVYLVAPTIGKGPHILLDSLRILFGNLVFAMDGEGQEALQLHRDTPSFVRRVFNPSHTLLMLRCNMSLVACHTLMMLLCNISLVTCHMVLMLRCNMSLVTCHTFLMLRCNMSLVACHTLMMLRCNMSLVTCHTFLMLRRNMSLVTCHLP